MLLYQSYCYWHVSHSWIIALHCLFCICAAPLWHNFREQCVWDDREISFDGWTCVWKSSWWTADTHEYGTFSYVITWLLLLGRIFSSAAFLLKSSFQSISGTVSSGVTITQMRPERKMSVQWHHRLLWNVRLHFSSLWHILSLWNPN